MLAKILYGKTKLVGFLLLAGWPGFSAVVVRADPAPPQPNSFTTQAEIDASPERLKATVTVRLSGSSPIYGITVKASSVTARETLAKLDYWAPESTQQFNLDIPAMHSHPGRYHLLLTLTYADAEQHVQQPVIGLEYHVNGSDKAPPSGDPLSIAPTIRLKGDTLSWEGLQAKYENPQLDLTAGPFWSLDKTYTPSDHAIDLRAGDAGPATPQWVFPQIARISWTENGLHHSALQAWSIVTDTNGQAHPTHAPLAGGPLSTAQTNPTVIAATVFALALTVFYGGARYTRGPPHQIKSHRHDWIGLAGILALTGWLAFNVHPELWFNSTWTTGGDTASHAYYAQVFTDWFWSGKISGWLPESFAGFPAFTFYFPLPFVLTALLSVPFGIQDAFNVVSMSPAVFLPAATYAMVWMMGWSVAARWFATLGATAFLFTTSTTFWGGNALATFTGEFAYGWGMMAAALYLGSMHKALQKGGRWWLVAALAETGVALSHGYPLLVVGFGSFMVLCSCAKPLNALRTILQVHALAFLLIAFWLWPLIENLPWTLPNDTPVWIDKLGALWPIELWPLEIGLLAGGLLIWKKQFDLGGFALLVGVALTSLVGFIVADQVGLAAARFFPLLQWTLCVLLGGALGAALERWNKRPLLWALTASFATLWWCQPGITQSNAWANWNLSGYESKPLWPIYRKVADQLKGSIDAPRIMFEHDPANGDTGSTRTMEAFPLFGTRPVLEGLYMESSLTAPFIYQLQAEVSEIPSSPSSRYTAVRTNADQAIAHMKELYADTLLIRSNAMKKRFRSDDRMEIVAELDPFVILKIKNFSQQLVEPITVALSPQPQQNWMDDAFARFRLAHPYQTRRVYLRSGQTAPTQQTPTDHATAKLIEFSRERLVFETNAIGQPHLIRMTYHPRWQSTTGEPIFLTEPAFMLVVPKQARVELVFGESLATQAGKFASILGLCLLIVSIFWPRWASQNPQPPTLNPHAFSIWISVLPSVAIVSAIIWWTNPERVYQAGNELFAKGAFLSAAPLFESAAEQRRLPTSKTEALFWTARSYELGADPARATAAYEKLRSTYPQFYQYPESAYRLIDLHLASNRQDLAVAQFNELEKYAPGNQWTEKAATLIGMPKFLTPTH